jgi:flagellar biosynthesis protein FliP
MTQGAYVPGPLWRASLAGAFTLFARTPLASAQQQDVLHLPGLTVRSKSTPVTIIVLLTLLTLIPAILLSMTPFVRILIVFHFLRQA